MLGTVMPTARMSLVFLAAFVPLFAAQNPGCGHNRSEHECTSLAFRGEHRGFRVSLGTGRCGTSCPRFSHLHHPNHSSPEFQATGLFLV